MPPRSARVQPAREPAGGSDEHRAAGIRHYRPDHAQLARTERDANANLARPLHDRIAQDAVQSDGGQHQANQREEAGEQREQPLAQERPIDERRLAS